MAFDKQDAPRLANGRPAADGFMNVNLVAADGTEYQLRTGVPLHATNRIENSILEAFTADRKKEFTIKVRSVTLRNDPEADTSTIAL